MKRTNSSKFIGSTSVRLHRSRVACDEEASFNPRTAEQMHADAMVDGKVCIKDGSEIEKKLNSSIR